MDTKFECSNKDLIVGTSKEEHKIYSEHLFRVNWYKMFCCWYITPVLLEWINNFQKNIVGRVVYCLLYCSFVSVSHPELW